MIQRVTLIVLVTLMAATQGACADEKNKDYAAMNRIPMHIVCVGRMLVDLPKNGKMDWQQQFDLATVSKLPFSINTTQAFWAYVSQREAELQQPTDARPKGTLGVYKGVGNDAVIMQFRDSEVADLDGYYTERYLWLGHWGYKYKTGGLYDNEAAELLHRIDGTFSKVHPINNFHTPSAPGFCIDSAMVTGRTGPIWDSISVDVKGWKGVSVSTSASEDDGSHPEPSWKKSSHPLKTPSPYEMLAMRESFAGENTKSNDEDRIVSFEVLRKRERRLAGMTGQETAFKQKLADGQEYYRFDWDSVDSSGNPGRDGFTFTLIAGDDRHTSNYAPPPPQKDLLALWDAMLDSLKPRPGAG